MATKIPIERSTERVLELAPPEWRPWERQERARQLGISVCILSDLGAWSIIPPSAIGFFWASIDTPLCTRLYCIYIEDSRKL